MALIQYKSDNRSIKTVKVFESIHDKKIASELAKLSFRLIYCYAGDLLDYGTYIRKRKDDTYYLEISQVKKEIAYIDEFEE
jgi:hypothetical protein